MTYRKFNTGVWSLRIISSVIMLQTLFFKFTAAPESVYIFSRLGLEPFGRIAVGCMELIASVLILIPRTTSMGALIAAGIMSGALAAHVTTLGIEVQGDSGQLFVLALLVFVASVLLLVIHRAQLLSFLPFKSLKNSAR